MAQSSADKSSRPAAPAKTKRATKAPASAASSKAVKTTAGGKSAAKTDKSAKTAKTAKTTATTKTKKTALNPTTQATTKKKTTASSSKTAVNTPKTAAATKPKRTAAKKPVAARTADSARSAKEKASDPKKTSATKTPEVAKTSSKAEVARKLMQTKAAKAKAGAKTKAKTKNSISFSLDEALQIAKKSGKSEKPEQGNTVGAPAAEPEKPARGIPEEVKQENRVLGAASIADILGYNPNAGPKKEEDAEIPPKFSRYYKLLLELREHVLSGLDIHTRDTLKRSAKEDSGDLSAYSQHMADAGTDTFDRDFALSLVSSEQDALYEIEDAIRRIRKGNYGVCEITGKPIKKERLLAVPFARFSVEGQAEYERTQRKSAYRGGAFGDSSDDPVPFMDDDSDE